MIKFIDAFAGIGGFHLGIQQAAKELGVVIECVAAIEIDKNSQQTYEDNFGIKPLGDITDIDPKSLPDHDLLVGGFPCQPFSKAGKYHCSKENKGVLDREDKRTNLLLALVDILIEKQPRAFIFENVKGILSAKNEDGSLYIDELKRIIAAAGYTLKFKIMNSCDFGLAQNRERIYFVGLRDGEDFEHPEPLNSEIKVVEDILEAEAPLDLFASSIWRNWKVLGRLKEGAPMEKNFDIPAGQPRLLALKQLFDKFPRPQQKLKSTINIASIEGDTPSGISRQADRLYSVKGLSPTIVTSTPILFDMNSENPDDWRALTSREYARLQGFPESFKIHPKTSVAKKQFGNAVSVAVVKAVAFNLFKVLFGEGVNKKAEHFTIGRITVNKDGEFGVVWWGKHAEQGGMNFTEGNMYSKDLEGLLKIVAKNMSRCVEIYKEHLKKRTKE